jgi:hypothetical protein
MVTAYVKADPLQAQDSLADLVQPGIADVSRVLQREGWDRNERTRNERPDTQLSIVARGVALISVVRFSLGANGVSVEQNQELEDI